jgi:hypothetical protein
MIVLALPSFESLITANTSVEILLVPISIDDHTKENNLFLLFYMLRRKLP